MRVVICVSLVRITCGNQFYRFQVLEGVLRLQKTLLLKVLLYVSQVSNIWVKSVHCEQETRKLRPRKSEKHLQYPLKAQ